MAAEFIKSVHSLHSSQAVVKEAVVASSKTKCSTDVLDVPLAGSLHPKGE